jgi:hypothetical protein
MIRDKDIDHLKWVYERMIYIHKENTNMDYMIRLDEIIKRMESFKAMKDAIMPELKELFSSKLNS